MRYAWIIEHRDLFPITAMCRVLKVARSGFYVWRGQPKSDQAQRRESQLGKIDYLAIREASKKWTMPIKGWNAALNRFAFRSSGSG